MATHEFGPIEGLLLRSFRRVKHSFHPRHARLKKCQVKRLLSPASPIVDVLAHNTKVYETKSANKFKDFLDFGVRRQLEPKKLISSIPKTWFAYRLKFDMKGKPIDDKDPESFPTVTLTITDTSLQQFTHVLDIAPVGWAALFAHKDHKLFLETLSHCQQLEITASAGHFALSRDGTEVLAFTETVPMVEMNPLSLHPLAWTCKLGDMEALTVAEKNFVMVGQLYSVQACMKDPVKYFFDFRYHVNGLFRAITGNPNLPIERKRILLERFKWCFESVDFLFLQPLLGTQHLEKRQLMQASENVNTLRSWIEAFDEETPKIAEFLSKELQNFTEKVWLHKEDQLTKSAAQTRVDSAAGCNEVIQKLYGLFVESKVEKLLLQLISKCSLCHLIQDTHNVNQALIKTAKYSFQLHDRTIRYKPEYPVDSTLETLSPMNLGSQSAPELNHYALVWKEDKILVHHKCDITAQMFFCDLDAADYVRRHPEQAAEVSFEIRIPPMTDKRSAIRKLDYGININPKGITSCIFEENIEGATLCHLYLNDSSEDLAWAKLAIPSNVTYVGGPLNWWQSVYSSQEGNLVCMARGENTQKGDPLELYCAQFDPHSNKLTLQASQICVLNFGMYNSHFWSERKGRIFSFLVHKSAKAMLVHCLDRQKFITIGRTTSTMRWINFSRKADEYFFLTRNRTVVGLVVRKRMPDLYAGCFVDTFARLNPAF